jgi:hypothetical protein
MAMGITKLHDDDEPEYRRARRDTFKKIFEKAADHDDSTSSSDHHASKIADLMVEARSFPDRATALHHLLHNKDGQALLARMNKADHQSEKESNMDTQQHLDGIMKSHGPIALAKYICESGAHGISESEFTSALTKLAAEQHPELRPDAAFAKIYETEETVRRACQVLKAAPFAANGAAPYLDLQPQVVGGEDARDVNDPSAALAAIKRLTEIGHLKWPNISDEQAFSLAFSDPANAKLALLAYQRPKPTTAYAFPR